MEFPLVRFNHLGFNRLPFPERAAEERPDVREVPLGESSPVVGVVTVVVTKRRYPALLQGCRELQEALM